MNRIFSRLGVTAFILVAGPALIAQTTTTGALNGTVTDNSGAPIAGAMVRFTSGQVVRTVTTGNDGHYSIGLLNAGNWLVNVSKSGFASNHQTVAVSINAASTANFKLPKEGGATVEVIATSSAVDSTSTTTGANFALDSISAIPKGRDIGDIAFMTPGVTGAGTFSGGQGLGISIAGASGAENSFSIDGLKTNDMRYGGQAVTMVSEFVDQIDVQTGGYKPEYSAMGGVFNVLTKSGSNEFAGSSWITLTPNSLKPGQKKNSFYSEPKATSVYDIGTWIGGAIVKDKLFYSVGLNYQKTDAPEYPNLSGQTVGKISTPNVQFFGKFNYYLNTDNQLTLSYFGNNQTAKAESALATPGTALDGRGNANYGGDTKNNTSNWNIIYDSTLTPTMTLSVKLGQSKIDNSFTPVSDTPLIIDYNYYRPGVVTAGVQVVPAGAGSGQGVPVGTRWSTGGSGTSVSNETNKTDQVSVDLSWILGSHALKAGISQLKSNYKDLSRYAGGGTYYLNTGSSQSNVSKRIYTNDSNADATFQAIYLQDTWQINKDVNIFYGARAEHQSQVNNAGVKFLDFSFGKYIQPRFGFTWDVKGDSLSKISGSYAWYFEQIPQRMAIRTYGNEYYHQFRWGAAVKGNDGVLTGTKGGYTPNGFGIPGFAISNNLGQVFPAGTPLAGQPLTTYDVDYSTGWSGDPMAENLKLPKREEIQLGFDQQVSATTTLGIHGHYRKMTDPLEDSVITDAVGNSIDPADQVGQAIIWNPNTSVTWRSPFSHQLVTSNNTLYPKAYNEYKAVDVSYTRKTENNLISLSYTWSRNYGNYEGLISPSNGQADANITASFDYYPYVGTGLVPLDRTHAFKAFGYQRVKVGANALTLGFNFVMQSGTPYSLQDNGATSTPQLPDVGQYGNSVFQNMLMGNKGRTSTVSQLDLNVHYEMNLTPKVKLEPLFEVFNVMNYRPETRVVQQATDATGALYAAGKWSSPNLYQAGRSIRFGAKLRF
jgi:outer membrane receptor for ferrienterochelin and colicin